MSDATRICVSAALGPLGVTVILAGFFIHTYPAIGVSGASIVTRVYR